MSFQRRAVVFFDSMTWVQLVYPFGARVINPEAFRAHASYHRRQEVSGEVSEITVFSMGLGFKGGLVQMAAHNALFAFQRRSDVGCLSKPRGPDGA